MDAFRSVTPFDDAYPKVDLMFLIQVLRTKVLVYLQLYPLASDYLLGGFKKARKTRLCIYQEVGNSNSVHI